jgi:hypothetical protein
MKKFVMIVAALGAFSGAAFAAADDHAKAFDYTPSFMSVKSGSNAMAINTDALKVSNQEIENYINRSQLR